MDTQWRTTRIVLRQALGKFLREDSLMISGSIAYHSLLGIFPLLLLLLGLSGLYIHHFELSGYLAIVLRRYLPMRPDVIMQNLVGISHAFGKVGASSFLLLLWSSSGVFLPLERAMNRAWGVGSERPWWRRRLLALEMAFVSGSVIVVGVGSVILERALRLRLENWLGHRFLRLTALLYHLTAATVSFGLALLLFLLLFERLPHAEMGFGRAFPGALLTAVLWQAARLVFTLLLPFFNYRHVYGSIGVLVALMSWAYISSALILFGAQVSAGLYRSFVTDGGLDL